MEYDENLNWREEMKRDFLLYKKGNLWKKTAGEFSGLRIAIFYSSSVKQMIQMECFCDLYPSFTPTKNFTKEESSDEEVIEGNFPMKVSFALKNLNLN